MAARWTPTDDRALRGLYRSGVSLRTIGEQLGRSEQAVSERRRKLGIVARTPVSAWTATEDALLRAATASGVPASTVAQRLGRSADQVRWQRRKIVGPRMPRRPYTAHDDARLRGAWERGDDLEALAHELGRTPGSLRLRAQALGVHRPPARRRWRPSEDAVVRDGYEQALSCAQIAHQLPGRNADTVAARAAKLGLATYARAWSQLDDHRFRLLSGEDLALEAIARALGRTPHALRIRARKLDLALPAERLAPRSALRWKAAEDEVLRINKALNPAVLAELLGRSSAAVTQRMRRLGLREGRSPHHPVPRRGTLTPGEHITAVRELRAGGPRRALAVARRLNVSPAVIRAAAHSTWPAAPRAEDDDL